MQKTTLGFRMYKIWQIFKRFAGTFHRARTLKLGGVYYYTPFILIEEIWPEGLFSGE